MKDQDKTKEQLINDLEQLRHRIAELKSREAKNKQTKEVLPENTERYRSLFEGAPDAIFLVDPKTGKIIEANQAASQLLLRPNDEIIGQHQTQLYPPGKKKCSKENFAKLLQQKKPARPIENVILRSDGSEVPVEILAQIVQVQGKPLIQGVFRNISEQKNVVESQKESEEKYRLLVENANDAIFIAQNGKIKFPNPALLAMTGYSAEKLSKISFVDLIHPEDRDMVVDRYERRLKGEKVPTTYSFRSINISGEEMWSQITSVLIQWEGRPATLNFVRNTTQQMRLEAQFRQAQKMEAIGTLAGGLANDFNNLLMGIQGYASLAMLEIDPSLPCYEKLKKIEEQVKSGAKLTKQLLSFAMGGKYEVRPTNLNEMVEMTSSMFGRTKNEIKIHEKYQKAIWTVEVDQGQIDQVLLDLYVNAWQAMPSAGDLYLETENVTLDENNTRPYQVEPGDYVKISITDTGVGMDEAVQQRVFEPFFTTEEMGRGPGLGLASAYGIIKSHGGIINVFSEKGKGTSFNIYLPAKDKRVIEEKWLPDKVLKGTETILLVDDEEHIVDVGAQLLKTLGYKVLEARSGKKAIEVYNKNREKIDMVILDMVMPGIGGGEAFDSIKEINPNIKILLASGYSINGEATEIMRRGCDGFIQKPFNMKELSQMIREILDKK